MFNKSTKKEDGAKENFAKLQVRLLVLFVASVLIIVGVLTSLMLAMAGEVLTDKVSALIAANSRQLELNINSYLEKVEATTTLIFANEEYYTYNPIDVKKGEYEKIKLGEAIDDRIVDLGLMENFCDFLILYSNGEKIGWLSNTTSKVGSNKELYESFTAYIDNDTSSNGWIFNYANLKNRMYYVKRLNNNAILAVSFYTKELESVFVYPEQLNGMEISLIDSDNFVLYSSNTSSIGNVLSDEVVGVLNKTENNNDKYIVNANVCENGWKVVCAIPKGLVFKEMDTFRSYAIGAAVLIIIIFCSVVFILLRKAVKPLDVAVNNLEEEAVTDRLSGLYNKLAFQDAVSKKLSESSLSQTKAFVMVDMDNFKTINDTLGHSYGDDVIVRMGKLLSKVFKRQYIVGRLGGDEFAIYGDCGNAYPELALKNVVADVERLRREFLVEYKNERNKIPISLSIGITVEMDERRFNNLYKHADEALYKSKKSGKNKYTIYQQEEGDNEV